jgi:hypothetical protein
MAHHVSITPAYKPKQAYTFILGGLLCPRCVVNPAADNLSVQVPAEQQDLHTPCGRANNQVTNGMQDPAVDPALRGYILSKKPRKAKVFREVCMRACLLPYQALDCFFLCVDSFGISTAVPITPIGST